MIILNGEFIFIRLYDVGQYIDIQKVEGTIQGKRDKNIIKTKDTPDYIDIPERIILEKVDQINSKAKNIKFYKLEMKLYRDGVISIILRLILENYPLNEFHNIRNVIFSTIEGDKSLNQVISLYFNNIISKIENFTKKTPYIFEPPESEQYTIFCIHDEMNIPENFIKQNSEYLAKLLMGENPNLNLHESQINNTFKNPFSFLQSDLIIFDNERCLILDSKKDYEDILLIIELIKFQFLELRTLDRFLDDQLEKAEYDIRELFIKSKFYDRNINKRLGYLFRLRYDMIFIWEKIINVSKIIGDFFLAQVYKHLSDLFQIDEWRNSIQHRLKILDDIYSTAKSNKYERSLVILELLIVILFIMEFIVVLLEFLIPLS